jgi:hypothetical protein
MIDISKYKLLTPRHSILNVESPLTLYYRNGEIITIENDTTTEIDLAEISGAQNEDFNLVFTNKSDEYVEKAKVSEDHLQALYCIFNFSVGKWCGVEQYNALEFLDAMYYNNEQVIEEDTNSIIV